MTARPHSPSSIVLLGGSFDPPHRGHVAIAHYLAVLLMPDELRILPAGNPWQKAPLLASAGHRIEMARLAFRELATPVVIDPRETERSGPTYTVDTLRELRAECGRTASLILAIGADQLNRLNTWRDWRSIFDSAHLCVVSRPGYSMASADLPEDVRREVARRQAASTQLRSVPHGLCCLAAGVAVDASATAIRRSLGDGTMAGLPVPPAVLDYIQTHQLYRT